MGRWRFVYCVASGAFLTACVALPQGEPTEEQESALDGAVSGVQLDAGPERPPTAAPYSGPQCATSTGDGGSGAPPPRGGTESAEDGAAGAFEHELDEPNAGAGSMSAMDASAMEPNVEPDADAPIGPPRPARADVVITEIMFDPMAVSDTEGEWIELWSAGAETFDLTGCQIDDGGASPRALPQLAIAPMQSLVIARAAQPGLVPDALLSLSFTNGMDRVALVCDGIVIDEVMYGPGFPLSAGASLSLDPDRASADENDDPEAWCAASTPFGGDRASPGQPNPSCESAAGGSDGGA
jgi:hypothetical protein